MSCKDQSYSAIRADFAGWNPNNINLSVSLKMNPNIISNHFAHLFSFYVLFSEWGSQWFFPLFFKCMHLYTREQIEIWKKKKQRSLEYHPMTYIGKRKYTSWFGGLKLPYNHTTYDDNCSRGDKKFRDRIFPPLSKARDLFCLNTWHISDSWIPP